MKTKWISPASIKVAFLIALVFSIGFASCASDRSSMRQPTGVSAQPCGGAIDLPSITKAAVLDFYEGAHPGSTHTSYMCHLTDLSFVRGDIESGSGETVADLFRIELNDRGISVVSGESLAEAMESVAPELKKQYGPELGREIAKILGVDAVFMGTVMRYEELIGGKFSADKPAAVSFSAAIIGPDGGMAWKAKFEKVQRPFFSNLLDYKTFFKGGMVWQKADTLASIGVANTLDESPCH